MKEKRIAIRVRNVEELEELKAIYKSKFWDDRTVHREKYKEDTCVEYDPRGYYSPKDRYKEKGFKIRSMDRLRKKNNFNYKPNKTTSDNVAIHVRTIEEYYELEKIFKERGRSWFQSNVFKEQGSNLCVKWCYNISRTTTGYCQNIGWKIRKLTRARNEHNKSFKSKPNKTMANTLRELMRTTFSKRMEKKVITLVEEVESIINGTKYNTTNTKDTIESLEYAFNHNNKDDTIKYYNNLKLWKKLLTSPEFHTLTNSVQAREDLIINTFEEVK